MLGRLRVLLWKPMRLCSVYINCRSLYSPSSPTASIELSHFTRHLNTNNRNIHTTSRMEQLLSTSFDLLSSYDTLHIRKGLRYLEGFLAKMCLQAPPVPSRNGARRESILPTQQGALVSKPKDAAFREFMRLQNGFEWNGLSHAPARLKWR
jgi:hypothetical protein